MTTTRTKGGAHLAPRAGRRVRWSLWHVAALVFALALAATITSETGRFIADARFEHFWDPAGYLTRHRSLWDDVRTLGRPTLYYSPVVASFLAALGSVGLPPWLLERVLHSTYLAVGAAGMAQVLRLHRPRLGAAHLIAGLLYAFNPYTSQFLVPSGLFLHYALAPWLVVALGRGAREPRRWHWPAVFALAVFSLGSLNAASLAYALLPLVPLAFHLLAVERSLTLRDFGRWIGRAGALTLGCCLSALVVVRASAPVIAQNLTTTELPEVVSSRSSWAESLRGLGGWLTYLRTQAGAVKPQAESFLTDPWVIVATFVVPAVAVAALAAPRIRARSLYGTWMIVGLVAMVHLYPVGDAPPFGRALHELYESQVGARGFRDGYKAGTSLLLGVCALAALFLTDVLPPLVRRITLARVGAAVVLGAAVVAAFPFWTGGLYNEREGVDEIPAYWDEALDWLNARPEAGTVMVVPGSNRTRYRWGYVGDDIFDAGLDRRHVARWSLPKATAETADLIAAIDRVVSDPAYRPGTLAPIAERLGLRWIVVRNDTDWQSIEGPRPSALDGLRADPDLELVATFGEPGRNTTAAGADGSDGLREREAELPPVEVYEIPTVAGGARSQPEQARALVSGDGDAIVELAGGGELDQLGPFAYTGSADRDTLLESLTDGGRVYVTDTNRRRITQVRSTASDRTRTLFAPERGERPPIELFTRERTESVLVPAPAASVVSPTDTTRAFEPAGRAGDAFDGVGSTAWTVRDTGESLVVAFDEPTDVDDVVVETLASDSTEGRAITGLEVSVDDGPAVPVAVPDSGSVEIDLGTEVSLLAIEVSGITPGTDDVGIAEIRIDDHDLGELVRVPDDLRVRAQGDEKLADALAEAPLSYRFRREIGDDPDRPEEVVIRRRLWVDEDRTFSLRLSGPARLSTALTRVASAGPCSVAVTIDESPVAVEVVSSTSSHTELRACDDVRLDEGWHDLATDPELAELVDRIALDDTRFPADPASPDQAATAIRTRSDDRPTSSTATVERPAWFVLDEAFDEGWAADIDGEIVAPSRIDTLNGWWVEPGDGPVEVSTWYRPQQVYDLTVLLSGASVALAGWIVIRRALQERRRRRGGEHVLDPS